MPGLKLSAFEQDLIRKMLTSGNSVEEVARALRRRPQTITMFAERMGEAEVKSAAAFSARQIIRRKEGWTQGKGGRVSLLEQRLIVARFQEGFPIEEIAEFYKRPKKTIMDIVARSHLNAEVAGDRAMGGVAQAGDESYFDHPARIYLIDEGVQYLRRSMKLNQVPSAVEAQRTAIAIGVLVDKRRLEEGLSTANTETHVKVFGRRAKPKEEP